MHHKNTGAHWLHTLALGALLGVACPWVQATAEAPRVPDTMAERMRACTPCHGSAGITTRQGYFPTIAGKPAGYLYQQLLSFREGRRHNAAMGTLFDNLNETYLREIAEHFAALPLPASPPVATVLSPQQVQRGAQLVSQGDPVLGVPACASCHGTALTGVMPATPGLLGLPQAYVVAQLGAWRSGQRRTPAPDCMALISRRLDARDVSAVAAYLAQLPMPQAAKAVAGLPTTPSMECAGMAR